VPPHGSKREKLYKPMSKVAPVNQSTTIISDYGKMKVSHLKKIKKDNVTAIRAIYLDKMIKAVNGNLTAQEQVIDRLEGKPTQGLDHTTGGQTIQFVVTRGTA